MTADLHTHILPGMDDGAQTIEESLELLKREEKHGADTVALTSHFSLDQESVDAYIERRSAALQKLQDAMQKAGISIRLVLAAEVMYSGQLLDMDLQKLCYADTNTILIELLPYLYPMDFDRFLFECSTMGYQILLAHVDRYPYLLENPSLLYQWVTRGCYCHVNASEVINHKKILSFSSAAIRHGLVHLVASDTHSIEKRPPLLREAFALLSKHCSAEHMKGIQENPKLLLADKKLMAPPPTEMKKRFGKYV